MGNIYEDDFGEMLENILKVKYTKLYKRMESNEVFLDWGNSINVSARTGLVLVFEYGKDKKNLMEDTKVVGSISFKIKLSFDEFGGYEPEGIVVRSVRFIKEQ